jgi:hypothetical protein
MTTLAPFARSTSQVRLQTKYMVLEKIIEMIFEDKEFFSSFI